MEVRLWRLQVSVTAVTHHIMLQVTLDVDEGKLKTFNEAVNYNSSAINIGSNFNSYS